MDRRSASCFGRSEQQQLTEDGYREIPHGTRPVVGDGRLGRGHHQREHDPVQDRHSQQAHPAVVLETVVFGPHVSGEGKAGAGRSATNLRGNALRSLPDL